MGRILIITGIAIALIGLLIHIGKFPFPGRLPGDIIIKRENFTFYFPIVTSILLSIVLTIILNLIFKFFK